MSHGHNQADRQASPRISPENPGAHPTDVAIPLAQRCLPTHPFTRSQSRARGVSLGTNRDRRLRHPAVPEVWDPESGLDWADASLLRHTRILIPFRFGAALLRLL